MRSLRDAVTFLTVLPLPAGGGGTADVARSAAWFPLVGGFVGAVLLVCAGALSGPTPASVAVVLVVIFEVVLTGALHLDGLADLADGTGGHDRVSRLRIMRDPATGVYGTAAVVLALLLEVVLLAELLATASARTAGPAAAWPLGAAGETLTLPLLLGAAAWSLSRAAMLPVALLLPYARAEGTGRAVVEGLTGRLVLLGWVVPLVLCLALGAVGVGMLVGALLGAALVGTLARRLLGGATGDVLGATAQVALLGALLGATAVL